jgi:hypothetical protein
MKKINVSQTVPDSLIDKPNGDLISSTVIVNAPAKEVWAIAGNFAGFPVFIPSMAYIEMFGSGVRSVRKKIFKDGNIVLEQLNHKDDDAMLMTWTLLYTSFNLGNLWASMKVDKITDNSCRATWNIIGEPWDNSAITKEGLNSFLQGFADDAMNNIKMMF